MLVCFFNQGPYVNGSEISAIDLNLAPKFYHLETVLGHFKNWKIPENLTSIYEYMKVCTTQYKQAFCVHRNVKF